MLFGPSSPLSPSGSLLVDGAVKSSEAGTGLQQLDSVGAKGSDQSGCIHGGDGARR